MNITRRNFLRFSGLTGSLGLMDSTQRLQAYERNPISENWKGVLIDTTVCIGCRKCEWACSSYHQLSAGSQEAFEDKTVYAHQRRPGAEAYTVVNQFDNVKDPGKPFYVKVQCMHCNDAACVSACLVGALKKDAQTGAVAYNSWRCIGCRYCLIACPFQIPAYEYHNALTPQVRKCTFCLSRMSGAEELPACVAGCPVEALQFGKRSELLRFAHEKIKSKPETYVDHVYGEHELGGTSWMYLSGKPMTEMGMTAFDSRPIPSYTEPLQHALFKNFIPPISLFFFIGGVMWLSKDREQITDENRRSR